MQECFYLLKQLIKLPSPTGREGNVARFTGKVLEDYGFEVIRQKISGDRINLFAYADEPSIVLSTHLDTVAPHIPFSEDDETIYGRGACDAKGPMAAQILCAAGLLKKGIRDVGLLFVVGEECGSDGARAANSIVNQCAWLINGEPTENRLALGSKGALRFTLTAKGRSVHAAYPEEGESAILKLLEVLDDLLGMRLPEADPLGAATMNIGTIQGGTHANVVPDAAAAEVMFRLPVPAGEMKKQVEAAVRGRAGINYQFECDPVFLERIEGFETTVVSFTTDIPLLDKWGKALLLGPGSIHDAHSEAERISKKELADSVAIYTRLVETLRRDLERPDDLKNAGRRS